MNAYGRQGPIGYPQQSGREWRMAPQPGTEADHRDHSATYHSQPGPVPTTTGPPPQSHAPAPQQIDRPPSPDTVKPPLDPEREPQHIAIVPDANPLTPTSPKAVRPSTTNMAIIPPPPDLSRYPIGAFTPTPQSVRGGSWQHHLCSCAEPTTCLAGLFCPCIVYGKTAYRLDMRADRKDPTNMLGYTAINGSCIAFAILCGVNGLLAAIHHTRIRKAYEMNPEAGNVMGDCLKGICCCCCVVAQDEKEMKYREEEARRVEGHSSVNEGYVPPGGMTFTAPPS